MATTFNGVEIASFRPLNVKPPEVQPVSFRPLNGGLSTQFSAHQLEKNKSPRMRDVAWDQDDIRKAFGSVQLGTTYPHPIVSITPFEIEAGTDVYAMVITQRKLYRQVGSVIVEITGPDLAGSTVERWATMVFDNVFYFVSPNNPIRRWPASGGHTAIVSGYAARGLMALNNHIVLCGTYLNAVPELRTVRWSQNYTGTISFTGIGSGIQELSDTQGLVQNCRAINASIGTIFKTDSIIEMRATGDVDNPFEMQTRASVGLRLAYAMAEYQGSHLFAGTDEQIYLYDGSRFDAIGDDIKREFFSGLDDTITDYAMATFNPREREYVIALPTVDELGCKRCYAYDIDRKRWRYFEYPGLNCLVSQDFKFGGVSKTSRKFFLTGTLTNKVLSIVPGSTAFDGIELQFSYETPDMQANAIELSLFSVVVGVQISNAISFALTVSISRDEGQTYPFTRTVTIPGAGSAGLIAGVTYYQNFDFVITGMQMRVKVSSAVAGALTHIHSIDAYVSPAKHVRPGAIR